MGHAVAAVVFCSILLTGMIAGLLFGTAIEQQQLSVLDGPAWLTARQSIDGVFSRLLPWLWNVSLLLLFASAYLLRHASREWFLLAGVLLLAGIAVTLIFEVPINKQVSVWTPSALPPQWLSLRDRWMRFHWLRTLMGLAAFVCALLALMAYAAT